MKKRKKRKKKEKKMGSWELHDGKSGKKRETRKYLCRDRNDGNIPCLTLKFTETLTSIPCYSDANEAATRFPGTSNRPRMFERLSRGRSLRSERTFHGWPIAGDENFQWVHILPKKENIARLSFVCHCAGDGYFETRFSEWFCLCRALLIFD